MPSRATKVFEQYAAGRVVHGWAQSEARHARVAGRGSEPMQRATTEDAPRSAGRLWAIGMFERGKAEIAGRVFLPRGPRGR